MLQVWHEYTYMYVYIYIYNIYIYIYILSRDPAVMGCIYLPRCVVSLIIIFLYVIFGLLYPLPIGGKVSNLAACRHSLSRLFCCNDAIVKQCQTSSVRIAIHSNRDAVNTVAMHQQATTCKASNSHSNKYVEQPALVTKQIEVFRRRAASS